MCSGHLIPSAGEHSLYVFDGRNQATVLVTAIVASYAFRTVIAFRHKYLRTVYNMQGPPKVKACNKGWV